MSRYTILEGFFGTSLLGRVPSTGANLPLSGIQSEVDFLVANGVSTATDPKLMASLYLAGLAGRFVRLGTLSALGKSWASFLPQGVSKVASLAGESAAFTSLEREWAQSQGPRQPFQKDWARSAITFGSIKFFGAAAHSQNLIVQHLMMDAGMVAGHGAGHALGLMEKPQGSLAEQLIEAEGMTLSLKASLGLLHGTFPRLFRIERSLDLEMTRPGANNLPKLSAPFPWGAEPAAEGVYPARSLPLEEAGRPWVAMSGTGGGGKSEPSALPESEIRRLISRAREDDPDAISKLAREAENRPEVVENLYVSIVNGEKTILKILGQAAEKSRKANQILGELAACRFEGALDILAEKAKTVPWARGVLFSLAYEGRADARKILLELAAANPQFERLASSFPTVRPLQLPEPPSLPELPGPLRKWGARLEGSRWVFLRRYAAEELGRSGFSEARSPLERALLHDASPGVRKAAAIALGRIKVHTAAPSLKVALHDPSAEIRIEAARSLSKLGVGTWNILTILRKNGIGQGSKDGNPFPWEEAFFQARLLALAQEPRDKKYYGDLKKLAHEGSQKAALILFAIDKAQAKLNAGEISKVTLESFIAEMFAGFPNTKGVEGAPLTDSEAIFFIRYFSPWEVIDYQSIKTPSSESGDSR